MKRAALLPLLAVACAMPTGRYLEEQRAEYKVVAGYVIRLKDLHSPGIANLKDGTAYTVTEPGCLVVLEHERGRRTEHDLLPGDVFVQSRPFSYVLYRKSTDRTKDHHRDTEAQRR